MNTIDTATPIVDVFILYSDILTNTIPAIKYIALPDTLIKTNMSATLCLLKYINVTRTKPTDNIMVTEINYLAYGMKIIEIVRNMKNKVYKNPGSARVRGCHSMANRSLYVIDPFV